MYNKKIVKANEFTDILFTRLWPNVYSFGGQIQI